MAIDKTDPGLHVLEIIKLFDQIKNLSHQFTNTELSIHGVPKKAIPEDFVINRTQLDSGRYYEVAERGALRFGNFVISDIKLFIREEDTDQNG